MCQLARTRNTKMIKTQCIPLKSCQSSEAIAIQNHQKRISTHPQYQIYLPAWICLLFVLCDPPVAMNDPCSHLRSALSLVYLLPLTCSRTLLLQFLLSLLDYFSSLLGHQTSCDILYYKISSFLDIIFFSKYSISFFFCSKTTCKQLFTPAASHSVSSLLLSSTFT